MRQSIQEAIKSLSGVLHGSMYERAFSKKIAASLLDLIPLNAFDPHLWIRLSSSHGIASLKTSLEYLRTQTISISIYESMKQPTSGFSQMQLPGSFRWSLLLVVTSADHLAEGDYIIGDYKDYRGYRGSRDYRGYTYYRGLDPLRCTPSLPRGFPLYCTGLSP